MNFYYYPHAIFYYNWIKSSFFERNAVSERFWKVLFKKLRFFGGRLRLNKCLLAKYSHWQLTSFGFYLINEVLLFVMKMGRLRGAKCVKLGASENGSNLARNGCRKIVPQAGADPGFSRGGRWIFKKFCRPFFIGRPNRFSELSQRTTSLIFLFHKQAFETTGQKGDFRHGVFRYSFFRCALTSLK